MVGCAQVSSARREHQVNTLLPTQCMNAALTFAFHSAGSSVSAGLVEAALQAAQWAEASVPLLLALRVGATCLLLDVVRSRSNAIFV